MCVRGGLDPARIVTDTNRATQQQTYPVSHSPIPPPQALEGAHKGADRPKAENGGEAKQQPGPVNQAVTTPKTNPKSKPKPPRVIPKAPAGQTCQAFLEAADAFEWERDFVEKPVRVHRPGGPEGDGQCDVPCFIGSGNE
jgi:hypothetical protein